MLPNKLSLSKKEKWRVAFLLITLFTTTLVLTKLWPTTPLKSFFPYAQKVTAVDRSLLRLTTAADEQYRLWVDLEEINPVMIEAILVQEDRWFYYHFGVNPFSLIRGAFSTYIGNARQGGSTLTMQLVRLIDRQSTRTPWRKANQVFRALWLEWRYNKNEILEAYLNFAPFGGNIQGVEAASWLYFKKPAADLSTLEAAILAVTPQQPSLRPRDSENTLAALLRLISRWKTQAPERQELHITPLAQSYLPEPTFYAPHAVDFLIQHSAHHTHIKSTIEPQLQQLLEQQLYLSKPQLNRQGIENASALLVHWPSREVVALVGSLDYFNTSIAGQVNGVFAKRSPGSTLKPLIYAAALEEGLIHPLTLLKDSPQIFGNYTPENFDGDFSGPLSATDALNRSRNIPAVALASKLSRQKDLYTLLKETGVQPLASRQHYGLSLVLGGGEVSAWDLARLYTLLANNGSDLPLHLEQGQSITTTHAKQLLSHEASYLVLEMLSEQKAINNSRSAVQHPWFTAWKTGTSWSFRDAWTVGVVGSYVLVIWIGNFDGSANPNLIGLRTAAPIWWRIADALPAIVKNEKNNRIQPANVTKTEICQASGDLPNKDCPERIQGWYIPGVSPIKISTLHRPVWLDKNSGEAVCPPYTDAHEKHIFEFWPSDMATLFLQAGLPRTPPPTAYCSDILNINKQNGPRIVSPYANLRFQLNAKGHSIENSIALQASADAQVKQLYWMEGNHLLGRSKPNEIITWQPKKLGRYLISVVDDIGRSDSTWVIVETLPPQIF